MIGGNGFFPLYSSKEHAVFPLSPLPPNALRGGRVNHFGQVDSCELP
jgi:hypothetical protein